ncbi:MAG: fibrobacter succinogenes major paralogous domain-containing protein [Bacteroidia bacterium]|nr:fibrobacter succinogenes major paralogous domain-containing protein [Bacteroidia bacterium]
MKRILLTLFLGLIVLLLSAQAPQSFKYQTVVRDAVGSIKANQSVSFRISILEGASPVYVEKFVAETTNDYGLVTLDIGTGSLVSGSFTGIDWQKDGPFFLKTEIDMAGGETFTEVGTSELLSVPFALHSETVKKLINATPVTGDMIYFNGTAWIAVPAGLPGQFLQLQTTNQPAWSGPAFPTLTTDDVSAITKTTAICGGNIAYDGGGAIQERGVCWSTSENPTIADSKTSDGSGTGSFISNLTDLIPSTTYYVRAYATNWSTGYGNQVSFTTSIADYDGNTYNTVTIGTQVWMLENLKTTHYRDGTDITYNVWSVGTEAYCWYGNDPANKDLYGALYNYYAVTDAHNLCPAGWHVPSDAEWTTLSTYLETNGYGFEGSGSDIAKSLASTSGWATNGVAGNVGNDQGTNNTSGFTGLPGGHRAPNGTFFVLTSYAGWWSTSNWNRSISSNVSTPDRGNANLNYGFSVRCIKD